MRAIRPAGTAFRFFGGAPCFTSKPAAPDPRGAGLLVKQGPPAIRPRGAAGRKDPSMFENFKVFETELAGRPLVVETGKMAQLANGECLVRYGDTVVHVAATASAKPRDGIDFFPLSVDFEEKLYSVGKIPGSFLKREGRPSEKAILTCRMIDRPIRPLFPKDMRNDVSIVATVMSVDQDNSPEIAALIGTSIALSISDIPWKGPISGVSVGLIDGEFVINPTSAQRKVSQMAVTVASTDERIAMIEAGANEVSDEDMYHGIMAGHEANQKIIEFIKGIQKEIGKEKFSYPSNKPEPGMFEAIRDYAEDAVRAALDTDDKNVRDQRLKPIYEDVQEHFAEIYPESEAKIDECMYKTQKNVVRRWLLDEQKRVDGRAMDQMRPLAAEVGLLPRVHGSGMFTRGQTQVITAATLGPVSDQQLLDGIDGEEFKRYMHQYNFPSYSVGETRPSRGPGRREIGHGALAERALLPVIPPVEEFPYAYRLVSEVVSSNGSTSQASICGSTLALMDAGVPIKKPVAGIAMGLIERVKEDGTSEFAILSDIQGMEDFLGDMDFKVTGTEDGVTAIQMDIKVHGLSREILEKALKQAKEGRMYIMGKMMEELSTDGKYAITDEMRAQLADFYGNYTSEEETAKTIKKLYEDTGYIIDTHTAVAAGVYDKYKKDTGDTETKTVIASTASPFKFTRSVMDAIDPKYDAMGDFELVDELSRIGNVKVPQAIEEIRTAPVLHDTVCEVEEMPQVVKKFLGV